MPRRTEEEPNIYAIMGITGRIGGIVARSLLADGQRVRAIVRDAGKGRAWVEQGCEAAVATIEDAASLGAAFQGASGVFVLVPSNFDPAPGFPEAHAIGVALRDALDAARPGRVVYLSTIGAQARQSNLLSQHTIIEREISGVPLPIALLRPAWFMENFSWDVPSARGAGVIRSFLQPLDKPVPMVATADIGRAAATLLRETWSGRRVVELEGPRRVTPNDVAATFGEILGRPVRMEAVPRDTWESLFRSEGMNNPLPRMQMLDGFNAGWIDFESGVAGSRKGTVPLQSVLRDLVAAGSNAQ